jgi:hypothetical protein
MKMILHYDIGIELEPSFILEKPEGIEQDSHHGRVSEQGKPSDHCAREEVRLLILVYLVSGSAH